MDSINNNVLMLGLGLAGLYLVSRPNFAKDTVQGIVGGVTEGIQDTRNIVIGRTAEAQQLLTERQGTILLGQPCAVNSDCSLDKTVPGPGGDAFSNVGCIRNKCDERNISFGRGSRYSDEAIDSLKENNTYVGDFRTVGYNKRCLINRDCSANGVDGGEPDPKEAKCCNSTCRKTKKDYLGFKVCPNVCKAGLFKAAGTCT